MTDEEIAKAVAGYRREVRRLRRTVVVCSVLAFSIAAAAIVIAVYASKAAVAQAVTKAVTDSEQKWCALLVPLAEGYEKNPPPTEAARRFAAIITNLRNDFDCTKG